VTYNAATRTATLAPVNALAALADYTARVSSTVTSTGGSTLSGAVTWSFRTAAASTLPSVAYAFSEGAGVATDDWSGNGNRASLVRGAAWGSGRVGNGLSLPGGSSDVLVPSSDSIVLTNALTFEGWVNPSTQDRRMLWHRNPDDTGGNPLYELSTLSGGAVYFSARLGSADYPLMTTATLPLNGWTHVALTFDGAWLRIYFNGVERASRTASGALGSTNEPMEIGGSFVGRLDEVRVYRRALGPAEIAADMATPVDSRESVISSLAPTSGASGQSITVAGINFGSTQGSSTVTFNGIGAAVTAWSATSIVATVPPGATTGPVVVTKQGVPSNGVVFTVVGPRISATMSPSPNAFGWNNSSVTVTFTCTATDSPISFCTSPQTKSFSGAGIKVTGTAIDANGVTATMVVIVNIDLAGPGLNVYSPSATGVFLPGTTSVPIRGSAVDVLSGLSSVTCAGVPALVVGQNFTCTAAVQDGTNTVQVTAQDRAGRSSTRNVSILVADMPPSALFISPATMTLLAGYGQALAVTDDRGRRVTGGTWSTSDQNVAVVLIDAGVPTVHALAVGAATVTLTRDGLSAQAAVTVLAADATPPDGTTLWSLLPTPNPQPGLTPGVREVVRAVRPFTPETSINQPPALFFVERGPYYQNGGTTVLPTVIRAVTADGRELWKYTLPNDPTFGGYAPVQQVVPDDRGGVVLVVSSSQPACCYTMNEVIRRIDGITGEVSWEYWHRETFGRFSEIALHPNGTVFVVEKLSTANRTELVAIDGLEGYERARYDLTGGHFTYPNASTATGPVVQDDGSVVAVVSRWDNQNSSATTPKSAWLATLPGVANPTFVAFEQLQHADGTVVNLGIGDIMSGPWPDGHGGFIVGDISPLQTSGLANVVHVGADRVTSPTVDLPFGTLAARDLQYILGDDAAYVLVQYWEGSGRSGATSFKLNPQTLAIVSSTALPGGPRLQLTSALVGGGVLYAGAAESYATQVSTLMIAGLPDSGPLLQQHTAAPVSLNLWSGQRGNLGRREARDLNRGIFVEGYPLVGFQGHTALRLVPRNQARWLSDARFYQDSGFNWSVTIGAESSNVLGCGGTLVSALNRPKDTQTPLLYFQRALYPNDREDMIIEELFQAFGNYHNDLPYPDICIPLPNDGTYNSNSYAHGLINATTDLLADPFIAEHWINFPGWTKPVPRSQFQPH